jgi:hypothetical protein
MPRSTFSAGNAGASSFIALNGNQGGGSKKQGLPPSTGHNANINYNRAYGNNRNIVFYMNQLGGVGKGRSMFSPSSDGVYSADSVNNDANDSDVYYAPPPYALSSMPKPNAVYSTIPRIETYNQNTTYTLYGAIIRLYNAEISPENTAFFIDKNGNKYISDENFNGLLKPYWSDANSNGGGYDANAIYYTFSRIDLYYKNSDFITMLFEIPSSSYISVILYYELASKIPNSGSIQLSPTTKCVNYISEDIIFLYNKRIIPNPFVQGNTTIYGWMNGYGDTFLNSAIISKGSQTEGLLKPIFSGDLYRKNQEQLITVGSVAPLYRISVEVSLFDMADGGNGCADTYLVSPGPYLPNTAYGLPDDLIATDFKYGYILIKQPIAINNTDNKVPIDMDTAYMSVSSCFGWINTVTPEDNFNTYTEQLYIDGCIPDKPFEYVSTGGGLANSPFFINTQIFYDNPDTLLTDNEGNRYMFAVFAPLQEVHDTYYQPATANNLGALDCANSTSGIRLNIENNNNLATNTIVLPAPTSFFCIRYRSPNPDWSGSPANVNCSIQEWNSTPDPPKNINNNYSGKDLTFPLIKTVDNINTITELFNTLIWDPETACIIES